MPRLVTATRYVAPLREGGSVPALVEADDDGLYVVKLRGSAQGPKQLAAELIAGEIGRALGLLVPDLVLVDLDARLADAEPDPEIQQPLRRSVGLNVGLDFLPGAVNFDPAADFRPSRELAADIVWFDDLVTNVDRDARNTNMLVWHRRLWLIDHGSALYIHHTWRHPADHAIRPLGQIKRHVLLPYAGSIVDADERLAPRLPLALLSGIVGSVPDEWLAPEAGLPDPAAHRAAYLDYLCRRLAPPRPFVEEAERARVAA